MCEIYVVNVKKIKNLYSSKRHYEGSGKTSQKWTKIHEKGTQRITMQNIFNAYISIRKKPNNLWKSRQNMQSVVRSRNKWMKCMKVHLLLIKAMQNKTTRYCFPSLSSNVAPGTLLHGNIMGAM